MAECIEREALRKILENWRDAHADVDDEQGCGLLEDVIWDVDAQPAADVVPVRHGQWRASGPLLECQSCGEIYSRLGGNAGKLWNYCPNCGAKMDGDSDES